MKNRFVLRATSIAKVRLIAPSIRRAALAAVIIGVATPPFARGQTLTWGTADSGITKTGGPIIFSNGAFLGDAKFVAGWGTAAEGGTIATSTDGVNWTARQIITPGMSGIFALGSGGTSPVNYLAGGSFSFTYVSQNGTTWNSGGHSGSSGITSITYGGGLFVAGGNSGMLETSSDLITWSLRTSGISTNINGLAYGSSLFLAAGSEVRLSTNGIDWTAGTATASPINGVTFGAGKFVGVSASGAIYTTTDGLTWANPITAASGLNGITFGGGRFVAVGNNGVIVESLDGGTTWLSDTSGSLANLTAVAFGSGNYVVMEGNASGQLLTATSAIPEPSTYAALVGVAALGFAAYRRRRSSGLRAAPPVS
jgi:hypothetical protein